MDALHFLLLDEGRKKKVVSPIPLDGLVLWLKGDAITGLSDGDPVATWEDQSGEGNDVSQATGAKKPLYKTGIINGKAVVRFDGTDDYLSIASDILAGDYDDYTIIVVYTNVADQWLVRFMFARSRVDRGDSNPGQCYLFADGKPNMDDYLPSGGSWASGHVTDDGGDHVAFFARTANIRHMYIDSNTIETDDPAEVYGGLAPTQTNIGGDIRDTENSFFTGDIAELAVYDNELSAEDWAKWKVYLNGRYDLGLT